VIRISGNQITNSSAKHSRVIGDSIKCLACHHRTERNHHGVGTFIGKESFDEMTRGQCHLGFRCDLFGKYKIQR
jgi:hypothetical protein